MKKTVLVGTLAIAALAWNCKKNGEVMATSYVLDKARSVAEWKGYLRTGYFNEGSIQIKSNNLTIQDGKVTGGHLAFRFRQSKTLTCQPTLLSSY